MNIELTHAAVQKTFEKMGVNLRVVRARLNRPLSLAEKILFGHFHDPQGQELAPGKAILALHPDRVAMQDATAQMALLQFMNAGRDTTAVPTTVHCDHLIRAQVGAEADMKTAWSENREVYEFLEAASSRYGIGFWKPGAGIIHQVVLENYAFPGGMMIGTDSHTPNAGGLGMIAVGVGGADAVDVMAGFPWEVLHPKRIGVKLTGTLSGWTSPKDVILKLCGILTTKGGTNKIVEYFGPGTKSISCTGKATITNMGAELGATTSLFPMDDRMATYLRATGRGEIADLALKHLSLLTADPEVEKDPSAHFDQVVEIDLSKLEPHLVGPHSPDIAHPLSKVAEDVRKGEFPETISAALIGSCTNSSYEDLERAADVARQAAAHGAKAKAQLMVTPGSEQIFETIRRDGQLAALEGIGAEVLANACGPCIGQWKRRDLKPDERNAIVTSFNRNFRGRNDGNAETFAFIGSPEITIAYGLAGNLTFNPLTDELSGRDGAKFRLTPPKPADEVPSKGFVEARAGYVPPTRSKVEVRIDLASERLQRLEPFPKWDGKDFVKLPVLLKVKGKCTTDHISPAGAWLKYRGHLERISDNMFRGAVNAFTGETGKGGGKWFYEIARAFKAKGIRWVAVGDENYGEGSSREHAAMSPRHLGAAVVIVRGFARIHETNLKKQGILPLTFANPADYEKVREGDRVSLEGLQSIAPGRPVQAILHHADGAEEKMELRHSLTSEQLGWFKAGSALNALPRSV